MLLFTVTYKLFTLPDLFVKVKNLSCKNVVSTFDIKEIVNQKSMLLLSRIMFCLIVTFRYHPLHWTSNEKRLFLGESPKRLGRTAAVVLIVNNTAV